MRGYYVEDRLWKIFKWKSWPTINIYCGHDSPKVHYFEQVSIMFSILVVEYYPCISFE